VNVLEHSIDVLAIRKDGERVEVPKSKFCPENMPFGAVSAASEKEVFHCFGDVAGVTERGWDGVYSGEIAVEAYMPCAELD